MPTVGNRVWQTGKVIRADQPKRRKPEVEVWNPWLTHWYMIETSSAIIKAAEMVPAGVKRTKGTLVGDADRDPTMAFQAGETVRFVLSEQPPDPKRRHELVMLDGKGKRHTLTVEEILPRSSR